MKIRVAVLDCVGAERRRMQSYPLTIEDVELDGPSENAGLVKIAAGGLCHSDLLDEMNSGFATSHAGQTVRQAMFS